MNAQELFLDVSSGRFLDGASTIPTNKPNFYSDEKRTIRLNVVKVQNNQITVITPSLNSRYKMRLGTTSQKLADASDVIITTANVIQASATVSTLPCLQAIAVASPVTYTPVTALFDSTITTSSSVTASFTSKITVVSTIKAAITATIVSAFYPAETFTVPIVVSDSVINQGLLPQFGGLPSVLTMSPIFNSPVSATFSCSITNGTVTAIFISSFGDGYIDGTYPITVSGGSPTITASISAIAQNGFITSISITTLGSGYSSVPSLSLFTPEKSITSVCVSNYVGDIAPLNPSFYWINPVSAGITVPLIFSNPTSVQAKSPNSKASGFLKHISDNYWSANVVDGGYGYESTASVTHGSVFCYFAGNIFDRIPDVNLGVNDYINVAASRFYLIKNRLLVRSGSLAFTFVSSVIAPFWIVNNIKYSTYYLYPRSLESVSFQAVINNQSPFLSLFGTNVYTVSQTVPLGQTLYKILPPADAGNFLEGLGVPENVSQAEIPSTYFALVPVGSKQPSKYAIIKISGRFNFPVFTIIDLGEGYSSDIKSWEFVQLTSLQEGPTYSSVPNRTITEIVSPEQYIASDIVKKATILKSVTAQNSNETIDVMDGGFGYIRSSSFQLSAITIPGGIKSVKLTNVPAGYYNGVYPCTISGGGGSGALIDLIIDQNSSSVTISNAGTGYTSTPNIIAIDPNGLNGFVSQIILNNTPVGYVANKEYSLQIAESPQTGGSAFGRFTITSLGIVQSFIDAPGFGYTSAPTITAPSPDVLNSGYISSVILKNSPNGYMLGREYNLQIGNSPNASGSAKAKFTRTSNANYNVQIIDAGYGYTSAPLVTAPAPDILQGSISAVAPTTFGRGFLTGSYPCSVPTSPTNNNASISLVVANDGTSSFSILNGGGGYQSAVTVSVATPNGNILNNISITCAGSYYSKLAPVSIEDASGFGYTLGTPIVSSGKILSVQVINGGSNFSNSPKVIFSIPTVPIVSQAGENVLDGDFLITSASAGAILSTQSSSDILLELFETDGTNEQVISQAVVGLSRRVLQ